MVDGEIKEFEQYRLDANGLAIDIRIYDSGGFAPIYEVSVKGIGNATRLLIMSLRSELLTLVPIDLNRIEDRKYADELKRKYADASVLLIDKYLPGTESGTKGVLIAYIINIMIGLGDLEGPLADDNLEEIVVNGGRKPVWVFHKKYGWCETNVIMPDDATIYNNAEQIGRRVGRQITNLQPLMDAELTDGSRVNATLFPISQVGNTITIRKFSKNPWTISALISNKTVSTGMASLIWMCVQNEISTLISGGTASGKTSFLNAISIFIPGNRRVISIEETRELTLPDYLQWIPMLTRQPNPEGKGEITLYDLMVNALRQRPDVMLVGEIRREKDAETLFEAIHTGHAVYGTVHADDAQDTVIRMTNPPIGIPKIMMNAIGGIVTLIRNRRLGIRRILEFGEMLNSGDANVMYRWNLKGDGFMQVSDSIRLFDQIALYGGYTKSEITDELTEKGKVLEWITNNKIFDVNTVGNVIASYYKDKSKILQIVEDNAPYSETQFAKKE